MQEQPLNDQNSPLLSRETLMSKLAHWQGAYLYLRNPHFVQHKI